MPVILFHVIGCQNILLPKQKRKKIWAEPRECTIFLDKLIDADHSNIPLPLTSFNKCKKNSEYAMC